MAEEWGFNVGKQKRRKEMGMDRTYVIGVAGGAADEEHLALSSTNVKEVAVFGGNIDFMVPMEIREFVAEKYKK